MISRFRFFACTPLLFICVVIIGSTFPQLAQARDCPSLCQGHLWAIGDSLELGGEFRAFYWGLSVGGITNGVRQPADMPTAFVNGERHYENNVFLAIRPLLYWYPVDGLTLAFEHESRFRYPGWDENVVPGTDFAVAGFDHRPTVLFLEYETHGFTVTGGLQPLTFGSAAVLDQRFIALSLGYNHRVFRLDVFGGMAMRNLMRNAGHSMWMTYTSATNGWKFISNNPGENIGTGLTFSLKVVRPFRLQLLYLYSNPSVEILESHSVAIHFAGPIWQPYLSFVLEPLLYIAPEGLDGTVDALPGVFAELRARFGDDASAPALTIGGISSFLHDDDRERRFSSVFENLSLGLIRRFNLNQGHVVYGKFSWRPLEYLSVFTNYFVAFPGGDFVTTDELDVGVGLQINELYRLNVAYVGLNLVDDPEPSHGVYAEMRIIIGPNE